MLITLDESLPTMIEGAKIAEATRNPNIIPTPLSNDISLCYIWCQQKVLINTRKVSLVPFLELPRDLKKLGLQNISKS